MNKESTVQDEKHKEALRTYHEYKRLRSQLGRPIRAFNDKEAILKDLQGDGFSSLRREIERARKTQKQHKPRSTYTSSFR